MKSVDTRMGIEVGKVCKRDTCAFLPFLRKKALQDSQQSASKLYLQKRLFESVHIRIWWIDYVLI